MHRGSNPRWWGARGGITVGQTRASGRNQHWGHRERTERGSPVSPLPQGRGRGTKEKDGGRGLPPCEDPESSGLVARTSIVVAEVGRRRLASNKLGKRAPKRAAGSSERGPSSSLSSVGETTGADVERKDESRVGLHRHTAGKDRRKAQGGERSSSSGRDIARAVLRSRGRGCNGHRILRRVPAGRRHLGHYEASAFTRRRGRWPRRFRHPPTRTNPAKSRTYGQVAALTKVSEA